MSNICINLGFESHVMLCNELKKCNNYIGNLRTIVDDIHTNFLMHFAHELNKGEYNPEYNEGSAERRLVAKVNTKYLKYSKHTKYANNAEIKYDWYSWLIQSDIAMLVSYLKIIQSVMRVLVKQTQDCSNFSMSCHRTTRNLPSNDQWQKLNTECNDESTEQCKLRRLMNAQKRRMFVQKIVGRKRMNILCCIVIFFNLIESENIASNNISYRSYFTNANI